MAALVGRESETRLIDATLLAPDEKRALLIRGASGLGKTHLLRWAFEHAQSLGFVVANRRIPLGCSPTPHKLAHDILDEVGSSLFKDHCLELPSECARTLNALKPGESREVSLPEFVEALESVLVLRPLAIIVDDCQWFTDQAGQFLASALLAVEGRLRLIASVRDGSTSGSQSWEFPQTDILMDSMTLQPLDTSGVSKLAEYIVDRPLLPSVNDFLFKRTLGNPLYVKETLRNWQFEGALITLGGFLDFASDETPGNAPSIEDLIRRRIESADRVSRGVLELFALVGREVSFDELVAIAGLTQAEAAQTVDNLLRSGFLTRDHQSPRRFGLSHPSYAAVIEAMMPPVARGLLHRRVYDGLQRLRLAGILSSSPLEEAHHGIRSLETPPNLSETLWGAAQSASRLGDHREAARWYGELAVVTPGGSAARSDASFCQAEAVSSFDPFKAIEIFTIALGQSEDSDRLRGMLGRATAKRRAGQFIEALEDLNSAVAIAKDHSFEVRHAAAVLHAIQSDHHKAEEMLLVLAAESVGTPNHSKAVGHLAHVRYCSGRLTEGRDLCIEALTACLDDEYRSFLLANMAWYLVLTGEWPEALRIVAAGLTDSESTYDVWNLTGFLNNSAKLKSLMGSRAAAIDLASRSVKLARRLGNPGARVDSLGALAWALLETGDFGSAQSLTTEIESLAIGQLEPREVSATYLVLAEANLSMNDTPSARSLLNKARSELTTAQVWEESVDRLEAQILLAEGNPAQALAVLGRWIEKPGPIVWEHARLLEILAQVLLKIGKRQDAIARVDEAIEIYTRLGAAGRLQRAQDWRAANYRRRPGRPKSALPGGITERERDVLQLVILGKTNKEIADALVLSVLTVNKHVENIMMKAAVARRTELVAFAERLGLRQAAPV